jgi:N-acetylneuraminic acid mutarotase
MNTTELYDPSTGIWTTIGRMNLARCYHTATLLENGMVLVAGGRGADGAGLTEQFLDSSELYDPSTGNWTITGNMVAKRYRHVAVVIENETVLVAGGWNGSAYLQVAEVYNPLTGNWTRTGDMNVGLEAAIGILLASGNVLVTGGINGGSRDTAELYNPVTGNWSITGKMTSSNATGWKGISIRWMESNRKCGTEQ